MSMVISITFLLVFGLFSTTTLKRYNLKQQEILRAKETFETTLKNGSEKARAEYESKKTQSAPKNLTVNNHLPRPRPEKKKVESTKDSYQGRPFKKRLNLYQLLNKSTDTAGWQKIYIELFKNLYSKEDFYTPTLAEELLSAWGKLATCSQAQHNQKHLLNAPSDLAQLDLKDARLNAIQYKILRGCRVEGSNEGYSSLCDFFEIHANKNTLLNLYYAPRELLSAIYDENTADYILKNKEVWKAEKSNREDIKKKISSFYSKHFDFDSLVVFGPPPK